ncbi:MAG: IS66 family transposase [Bacteroidetes bacterium]|nr:IS66 family transposase [Bacteroidales bacterium]NJO67961.1 IS66 family transposase [Bacteroidota bacterium]
MVSKDDLRKLDKEELVDFAHNLTLQVDRLISQVNQLTQEVKELREEIAVLKNKKNSGNSSLPPSQDLFALKNQSLRGKTNRKSGGQPGHKGETLRMSANPDKIVQHFPDTQCPECGTIHSQEAMTIAGQRQVIDIPVIKAYVTEHQIYQLPCACGCVRSAKFPANVSAPVQYGPNLIGFTAYLSSRQFVPYSRLSELVASITNISMSEGTIFNMLQKASDAVTPIYDSIKEEVANATCVGGDETGVKVNNQKHWAWTWQTTLATYIVISGSRGFGTVTRTFPNGFPEATYVSDSLSAQLKTTAKSHQLCLAHLLRELTYFQEIYLHPWPTQMKALLQRAIALKNTMTFRQYTEPLSERNELLLEFGKLIDQDLPYKFSKIFPFLKRLVKRRHQIFTFLFYPQVPYDNNGSERAIRNIKVKQKVSGGFRSERGAEMFAILRSVFDTIIKKGGNPFDNIRFALNISDSKQEFVMNH